VGAALAAAKNAPLLFVNGSLTPETQATIVRVLPAGGTVYLLGGTAAIPATRPLIAAEPMLRAPSPEMVSESTFATPVGWVACAKTVPLITAASAIPHGADFKKWIIRVTLRQREVSAARNECCRWAR